MNKSIQSTKLSLLLTWLFLILFSSAYGNSSEAKSSIQKLEKTKSEIKTSRKQHQKLLKLQQRITKKQQKKEKNSAFKEFLLFVLFPLTVIGGLVKFFAVIIGAEISTGALILISLGLYGLFALSLFIIILAALGNK
jgi:hypothetical protein